MTFSGGSGERRAKGSGHKPVIGWLPCFQRDFRFVPTGFSFGLNGKVLEGNAIAANRTREIRPSGMRGWLAETLVMVELGTHCTNRKGA